MFYAKVLFFRQRSETRPAGEFPRRFSSRRVFPAEGYRPHLAIKGTLDMLGVVFAEFTQSELGRETLALLEYLYPRSQVDYSALTAGSEFWILEGGTAVGEGVVL